MKHLRFGFLAALALAGLVVITAQGMMGGGYGMMGGVPQGTAPNVSPLGMDRIKGIVTKALADRGDKNLLLDELLQFSNGFYALVKERDSGKGAMELLIDPYSGSISPEFGPNMMWNAKYGPMAFWKAELSARQISADDAKAAARRFLDSYGNNGAYDLDLDEFYGYYTIDVIKDGRILGMLSVNSSDGAVWYHSWHGTFVARQ